MPPSLHIYSSSPGAHPDVQGDIGARLVSARQRRRLMSADTLSLVLVSETDRMAGIQPGYVARLGDEPMEYRILSVERAPRGEIRLEGEAMWIELRRLMSRRYNVDGSVDTTWAVIGRGVADTLDAILQTAPARYRRGAIDAALVAAHPRLRLEFAAQTVQSAVEALAGAIGAEWRWRPVYTAPATYEYRLDLAAEISVPGARRIADAHNLGLRHVRHARDYASRIVPVIRSEEGDAVGVEGVTWTIVELPTPPGPQLSNAQLVRLDGAVSPAGGMWSGHYLALAADESMRAEIGGSSYVSDDILLLRWPVGDSLPAALAAGAEVRILDAAGRRVDYIPVAGSREDLHGVSELILEIEGSPWPNLLRENGISDDMTGAAAATVTGPLAAFDSLAAFDDVFDRTLAGSSNGGWIFRGGGSTLSNNTGPHTSNLLPFVSTETSGSSVLVFAENGIATMQADDIPAGFHRMLRLRLCIQGTFGDGAEGLRVQTRSDRDIDDWSTVRPGFEAEDITVRGWLYRNYAVGDHIVALDGTERPETVAAGGGWVDFDIPVPDDATQVRLYPRYILGDDDTYTHDVALAQYSWLYDAVESAPLPGWTAIGDPTISREIDDSATITDSEVLRLELDPGEGVRTAYVDVDSPYASAWIAAVIVSGEIALDMIDGDGQSYPGDRPVAPAAAGGVSGLDASTPAPAALALRVTATQTNTVILLDAATLTPSSAPQEWAEVMGPAEMWTAAAASAASNAAYDLREEIDGRLIDAGALYGAAEAPLEIGAAVEVRAWTYDGVDRVSLDTRVVEMDTDLAADVVRPRIVLATRRQTLAEALAPTPPAVHPAPRVARQASPAARGSIGLAITRADGPNAVVFSFGAVDEQGRQLRGYRIEQSVDGAAWTTVQEDDGTGAPSGASVGVSYPDAGQTEVRYRLYSLRSGQYSPIVARYVAAASDEAPGEDTDTTYTAGAGLDLDNINEFSVDLADISGLELVNEKLRIRLSNTGTGRPFILADDGLKMRLADDSGLVLFHDSADGGLRVARANAADVASGAAWRMVDAALLRSLITPGRPTGLAASEITSRSMLVSWTAPADGPAVTGYRVEWRTGDGDYRTYDASVTDIQLMIGGLDLGRAYDLRVKALGAVADSGYTTLTASTLGIYQTFAIGAPTEEYTNSVLWRGDIGEIDRGFSEDDIVTYLREFSIIVLLGNSGTNVEIRIADSATGSGVELGPDLIIAWERYEAAIVISAGNLSLTLHGPSNSAAEFADILEPYNWRSSDAQRTAINEFVVAYLALAADEKAATTLTLQYEP